MAFTGLDDLDDTIPPEITDAMSTLLMAWPLVDSGLSAWLASELRLPFDEAAILFGGMDGWTKLNRLKELFAHRGNAAVTDSLTLIMPRFQEHSTVRNTIAHKPCIGMSKSEPGTIYFSPFKVRKGVIGELIVQGVTVPELVHAALFARDFSAFLLEQIEHLLGPRPSPPEAHPPIEPTT
jgi:hypothetical protein